MPKKKLRVKVYRDSKGRIHRIDGPAVIGPKFEGWYYEGRRFPSEAEMRKAIELESIVREVNEENVKPARTPGHSAHASYSMADFIAPFASTFTPPGIF